MTVWINVLAGLFLNWFSGCNSVCCCRCNFFIVSYCGLMVNIMISVTTRNTHDGICLWVCLCATIGESEGQATQQWQPC